MTEAMFNLPEFDTALSEKAQARAWTDEYPTFSASELRRSESFLILEF